MKCCGVGSVDEFFYLLVQLPTFTFTAPFAFYMTSYLKVGLLMNETWFHDIFRLIYLLWPSAMSSNPFLVLYDVIIAEVSSELLSEMKHGWLLLVLCLIKDVLYH